MATGGVSGSGGASDSSGAAERAERAAEAQRQAAERAAAERAAAEQAAAQARLSLESQRALAGAAGQSAFEVAGARPGQVSLTGGVSPPVDVWEVADRIEAKAAELTAATAEVKRLEEQLATELATLAGTLPTEELQRYADGFRESHPEYQAARETARELVELHEDVLPGALDALEHSQSFSVHAERTSLDGAVDEATRALEAQIAADPVGDAALAEALERAGNTLSTLSTTAAAGGGAATGAALTATRLAALAGKAASAFGFGGGVLDAALYGQRIADGTARAEHYVGTAAAVAEIGVGVAAVAGVAVSAPAAIALAVVGAGAGAGSSRRDTLARQASIQARLESMGYAPDQAKAFAEVNPAVTSRLAAAGYTPEQLQELAQHHAGLVTDSGKSAMVFDALERMGITPDQVLGLVDAMSERGIDVGDVIYQAEMMRDPENTRDTLAAIQAADYRGADIVRYLEVLTRTGGL
ncbi:MAG: hypothetical protein JNK82_14450 [Myxococcaceae bacterium]|nr:hypothetical protein [Myxococcaceae bacterium]